MKSFLREYICERIGEVLLILNLILPILKIKMSGGSTPPSFRTTNLMHLFTSKLEKIRVEIDTKFDNERRKDSQHKDRDSYYLGRERKGRRDHES